MEFASLARRLLSRPPLRGSLISGLVVLGTTAIVAVGCGSQPSSSGQSPPSTSPVLGSDFTLLIANIDGPPLDVVVNGKVTIRVTCQVTSQESAPVLKPGPELPLPWAVHLVKSDGQSLGEWTETGTNGPRMLLIRGADAAELPAGTPAGPAPAPSCVP